jgi:hypothetical protein
VPDSLDVAKQRKLIEDLKRDGLQTQDAETRLRSMLEFMMSARSYRTEMIERPRHKNRREGIDAVQK